MRIIQEKMQRVRLEGNLRQIPSYCEKDNNLINLCSNDYLSIGSEVEFQQNFLENIDKREKIMSFSCSRLLNKANPHFEELELFLAKQYDKESALLFNSGFAANCGIISSFKNTNTLILADKEIHASIIDGIILSKRDFIRFRHNDYQHLREIIQQRAKNYNAVLIVSESIFSISGSMADLDALVKIKKEFDNTILYLDEAHALGVRGNRMLGLADEKNLIKEIDILVGTFGKAICSEGAFVVCSNDLRDFFINHARTLIYSTAIAPINVMWSLHVMKNLSLFKTKKHILEENISLLRKSLLKKTYICNSQTQIMPIVVGESHGAIKLAQELKEKGFYAMAIRPPTVEKGKACVRISLNADLHKYLDKLTKAL